MKLETKYHGIVDVNKEEVLSFPNGLPGFQDEKEFIIIPFSEDGVFQILQSTVTPQLGFVMTTPFSYFKDYDFQLEDQAVESLELESAEDVAVYTVLTVQDPFHLTTANLQAPIVINKKKNIAKQVILTGTSYVTKHKLFSEVEAK